MPMEESRNARSLKHSLSQVKKGKKVPGLAVLDLEEELEGLFWEILSYPSARITGLYLSGGFKRMQRTCKLVRKWIEEIRPGNCHSVNIFLQDVEQSVFNFEDLCVILTHPNGNIKQVTLRDPDKMLRNLYKDLLCPVLENPNNGIKWLCLSRMAFYGSGESKALIAALASPNSKLTGFYAPVVSTPSDLDGIPVFASGLMELDRLEVLHLRRFAAHGIVSHDHKTQIITGLVNLIQRGGNNLRILDIAGNNFRGLHIQAFCKAMMSEHCRVEKLTIDGVPREGVNQALAVTLRHPNNRIRSLDTVQMLWSKGDMIALGTSLDDPNCKLESLELNSDIDSAVVLANVLETSKFNCIRDLRFTGVQSPSVFRAFTASLRSRNNKLKHLQIPEAWNIGHVAATDEYHFEFYRAVRMSNLVWLSLYSSRPFVTAFAMQFVQVLYTLLSVRQIPRLGKSAPMRILPFQDHILKIAEVLAWPLDKLRLGRLA